METEVKKWLTVALAEENLETFSVAITGDPGKGVSYMGQVFFVVVTGTTKQGEHKKYDLVLKCSKCKDFTEKVPALRKLPLREAYVYKNVFPLFKKFQERKGIEKPFDNVPKCYGVYNDGFRIVLALENLKPEGYEMWPTKGKPMTRDVILTVLQHYAKLHAISVALKEQEPEKFEKVAKDMKEDVWSEFFKTSNFTPLVQNLIQKIYELLKDDVGSSTAEKWLKLKDQIAFTFFDMHPGADDVQVVTHGDSWLCNFLWKFTNEEKTEASHIFIVDWQISKFGSPVYDLAYFLFTAISEEDLVDMDTILGNYYNYFCEYLTVLGSNFGKKFTVEKLIQEWRMYGRYGLLIALMAIQSLYVDDEDVPNVNDFTEVGDDFSQAFKFNIRNIAGFKKRVKPIVEYVVKKELVK